MMVYAESTQRNRLPNHILSAAESLLPGRVTQHHYGDSSRQILARIEITAQHRRNAQGAKEAIADPRTGHQLGPVGVPRANPSPVHTSIELKTLLIFFQSR